MQSNPQTAREGLRAKLQSLERPDKLDFDFIEARTDDLIELIEAYVSDEVRRARINEQGIAANFLDLAADADYPLEWLAEQFADRCVLLHRPATHSPDQTEGGGA